MTKAPFSASRAAPRTTKIAALVFFSFATIASVSLGLPFGKWTRLSVEPIVTPKGDTFESAGTFNPTVVKKDGAFVMLYRAQDRNGKSSLGYATSNDGVHFNRRPEPVMVSEAPYEKGGESKTQGCKKLVTLTTSPTLDTTMWTELRRIRKMPSCAWLHPQTSFIGSGRALLSRVSRVNGM